MLGDMTIRRMDNVAAVVDDLDAAVAFFTELGMELEGKGRIAVSNACCRPQMKVTARITQPIGYLMGLSGLAWLVLGWLVGTRGFTSANTLPQYAFFGLTTAWIIWLLISAVLMKEPSVRAALASK